MPRLIRFALIGALAIGGVLLFVLASATGNTRAFERNYPILLVINGAIAALLFLLLTALVVRMVRRVRARRFGARLMARFAVAFAVVGVVPGALVYLVSVQFLSRSIESWFDVRVDRALESGLALGRSVLESQRDDLNAKARIMALELAEASVLPDGQQVRLLDRLRERAGVDAALLLTGSGSVIGASSRNAAQFDPDLPPASALRSARSQRGYASIEGDELSNDPQLGLRTRVIMPIPVSSTSVLGVGSLQFGGPIAAPRNSPSLRMDEPRYLQLLQAVPASVAANAQALRSGYADYQELSLARSGLRKIFALTLTLALLLAVFAAMAAAVMLASAMTAPLVQLAAGTKAVAEGDYRPVREFQGKSELNVLTRSFNAMIRQLSEARDAVETRSRELEHARAYLERLLGNLSAGVIVLDRDQRVVTANHGAARILGVAKANWAGNLLATLAPALAEQVQRQFSDQELSATPKDSWQSQLQVPRAGARADAEALALLARGSKLPLDDGPGFVVVFDDITQVISAQRAVAWGEVARRLAHEIKNPLTPIQLSAERLQMKLASRLPPEDAEMLRKSATVIVNQVAAMKRMVDEFRDYARLPPIRTAPLDLNALIEEVGALYGAGESEIALDLLLAPQLPMIDGDASQLRQVIHNLIGNAQESIAGRLAGPVLSKAGAAAIEDGRDIPQQQQPGRIVIRTEAVEIRESGAAVPARAVRLALEDNGPGFPANILRRAFEPYVTTKPSGTGLGLAMVKKIVDEHGARIELINRKPSEAAALAAGAQEPTGATVTIVFRRLSGIVPAPGTLTGTQGALVPVSALSA